MVSSSTSAIFDGTMVNVNNNTINKKISKGRQKIEIKKIEAKESRQVTFSKRRTGLFKKAVELCVMTEAKVAILVKSPGGKVFVLGEDLIDWYINNVVETAQLGFPRNDECDDDEVGNNEEEPVVETGEVGIIPYNTSNSDNKSVDEMDIEHAQLEEYAMKKDADMKVDELEMNNNIPAMLGLEERKKNEVVEANDSEVINNSDLNPAVLDSDLLDMSWLDLDPYDMSWIDSCDHGDLNTNDTYNLNFQHGVEV